MIVVHPSIIPDQWLVCDELEPGKHMPICATRRREYADRIAELLGEHGVADVPADASSLDQSASS